ncbi:MAG: Panacea domain-containing protein [Dehalococcoidia bacterium]
MTATAAFVPDEKKLRELIVYLAVKCQDDERFGGVKLNKMLYMIDMFAYAETGKPVTGVEYMKQKAGPVPRRFLPAKRELLDEGAIFEVEVPVYGVPNPLRRIIPQRKADLTLFTADEIAHTDSILDMCREFTGTALSAYSHEHLGWRIAPKMGDTIPYSAVFLSEDPVSDYEVARAEMLIKEHDWDVRGRVLPH